jgi:hypothetical protein
MRYVKVDDENVVMYSVSKLREDNPGDVIPADPSDEFLASYNVYPIVYREYPPRNVYTQTFEWGDFYLSDIGWTFDWIVVDLPEEIASRNVRFERGKLLLQSDWTQLVDSPVDSAAWATYRQELRDIPQQEGFPYEVVWPPEPS